MLQEEGTGQCVSASSLPGFTVVVTEEQTAGRGQQGNSWEAERGKNILFSLLCHPDFVRASKQFLLSQCMALAIRNALAVHVEGVMVKWPNDIYVGDKKISGTLIECDLMGKSIANCIIGTGVNINQEVFVSDAPNPTSLKLLTGREYDKEEVLADIIRRFAELYDRLVQGEEEAIRKEYMQCLYRKEGMHEYEDVRGRFMAEIAGVEPTGHLLLKFENGNTVRYEFKEVKFVL